MCLFLQTYLDFYRIIVELSFENVDIVFKCEDIVKNTLENAMFYGKAKYPLWRSRQKKQPHCGEPVSKKFYQKLFDNSVLNNEKVICISPM